MQKMAALLRQAAEVPGAPPEFAELLEMIAQAAEATRDDNDPMQLRRDIGLAVRTMQERYGDKAIERAELISSRLGKPSFARIVISSLKRRARAEQRIVE